MLGQGTLTGYATESYVDGAIAAVDHSAYLTSDDLTGYATESWVTGQGYGLAADVATNAADIAANAASIAGACCGGRRCCSAGSAR